MANGQGASRLPPPACGRRHRRRARLGTATRPRLPLSAPAARVAVVTGASSGIGAVLAGKLAERGWRLVLLARREDRLRALAAEVGAEWEVCDVADREAVERVAASVCERHPEVGLLVNNAGIAARVAFLDSDPAAIEDALRINYLGSLWSLRAFLPALERARPSHVVNVVSVAGTVAFGRGGPYAASKHAQLAFSRGSSADLAARGVQVHTVNPGFAATEGFPQTKLVEHPLLRRLVVSADYVAERIIRAVERGKPEVFVPPWYRPFAVAQALFPGTLTRLVSRRRARGGR